MHVRHSFNHISIRSSLFHLSHDFNKSLFTYINFIYYPIATSTYAQHTVYMSMIIVVSPGRLLPAIKANSPPARHPTQSYRVVWAVAWQRLTQLFHCIMKHTLEREIAYKVTQPPLMKMVLPIRCVNATCLQMLARHRNTGGCFLDRVSL